MSPDFPLPRDRKTAVWSPTEAWSPTAAWHGALGGLLCWFLWRDLGFLDLIPLWRGAETKILASAILGAVLGLSRLRWLIAASALLSLFFWCVVAFTPLFVPTIQSLIVRQNPTRADAVVVLLASIQGDDDFGTPSLERTLHGLELVQRKFAPRLILTQGFPPEGSHRVAASRLMSDLGIHGDLEVVLKVVGPVRNTRDEAIAVSQIARQNGWRKILLVTSPIHSKRSALVFAKTGLQVVSVPCRETSYDIENLVFPLSRVSAFNAALHEIVGLRAYRARGWI